MTRLSFVFPSFFLVTFFISSSGDFSKMQIGSSKTHQCLLVLTGKAKQKLAQAKAPAVPPASSPLCRLCSSSPLSVVFGSFTGHVKSSALQVFTHRVPWGMSPTCVLLKWSPSRLVPKQKSLLRAVSLPQELSPCTCPIRSNHLHIIHANSPPRQS